MKRFSVEELEMAQSKFNDLCKNHGLKPWDLTNKKGHWRELCHRIVGIPPKGNIQKKGRRARSEEEVERVGARALLLRTFTPVDQNTGMPTRMEKEEITDDRVAQEMGITASKRENSAPHKVVRGIRQKYEKQILKENAEKSESSHPNDDF